MKEQTIEKIVIDIVKESLTFIDEEQSDKLLEHLELDSMSFMTIVLQIENRFGIQFGDDYMIINNFKSVQSLADHIQNRLNEKKNQSTGVRS